MRRAFLAVAVTAAVLTISAAANPAAGYDPYFAAPATAADFGAAARPFGVAAGDFDGDGKADLVVGRTSGNVAFVKGTGDGTYAGPAAFAWKQTTFNAWAFAPADVDGDGRLDVVWGANTTTSGCSISPIPVGQTCASAGGTTVTVNEGDVRVFRGNGDGTFVENTYFVSGVRHNGGVLLADIGSADAGSLTAGDVDGDGDADLVAGALDGANAVVRLLRNSGTGSFVVETIVSQAAGCSTTTTTTCAPTYFPPTTTAAHTSPWGLALGDADADGDADLFVGDRALYVYLYLNGGAGSFSLQGGNSAVAGRPNVYLGHDAFRAAVGFTPSLAAADFTADGRADLAVGLHSGGQTPASGTANDGLVLLDVSKGGGHTGFGALADVGTAARGLGVVDANGDGVRDLVAGEYDGKVKVLRQLPPIDSDADGMSDYVDNAVDIPNAPRVDMNTDGAVNHRDQLDNDFDSVLGDPEQPGTWLRLGDVVDPDDDNDGALDELDNCPFVANGGQADADTDGIGNACDPHAFLDPDSDGVATGPLPGDADYAAANAAAARWSRGDTHFVVRIDALGRFFQNEFTQLMTDAATLSPAAWAAKCWENYEPGDVTVGGQPYEPCGTGEGTPEQTVTLPGGREVPVTLVVIPKQLWTDPPVVAWINDRNDSAAFDLGQHGTYHASNTTAGDWAALPDRNFYSCETCGLSEAEAFELLKVGQDTLLGNYANKWVAESGATAGSPKIDWSSSARALRSYAPPFNASDEPSRDAVAQLGFLAFSASAHEEASAVFSPSGDRHEQWDPYGLFHVSADVELEPPETAAGTYDRAAYAAYLASQTQDGGLNTWLIEEVEWSGRPCNDDPRIDAARNPAPATCPEAGGAANNRENNTVYSARWDGWMQLLDYVRTYPGGVVMTMDDVALAKAYDNAPTVPNTGQADADHDGIGDVIEGASLAVPAAATLARNTSGQLTATLTNGSGDPLAGQTVSFSFDADGDGAPESYDATTDASGVASPAVTPTRPVGPAGYDVSWDGLRSAAGASGSVSIADSTHLSLLASNPASGQVTDSVQVAAELTDSDGAALPGQTVEFSIGTASGSAVTDAGGVATATLTLAGPAGAETLTAAFFAAGAYAGSAASSAFTVAKEVTLLTMPDASAKPPAPVVAAATLREQDGAPLVDYAVEFYVEEKTGRTTTFTLIGSATTDAGGVASFTVPARYLSKTKRPIRAVFAGDGSFLASTANASAFRR